MLLEHFLPLTLKLLMRGRKAGPIFLVILDFSRALGAFANFYLAVKARVVFHQRLATVIHVVSLIGGQHFLNLRQGDRREVTAVDFFRDILFFLLSRDFAEVAVLRKNDILFLLEADLFDWQMRLGGMSCYFDCLHLWQVLMQHVHDAYIASTSYTQFLF